MSSNSKTKEPKAMTPKAIQNGLAAILSNATVLNGLIHDLLVKKTNVSLDALLNPITSISKNALDIKNSFDLKAQKKITRAGEPKAGGLGFLSLVRINDRIQNLAWEYMRIVTDPNFPKTMAAKDLWNFRLEELKVAERKLRRENPPNVEKLVEEMKLNKELTFTIDLSQWQKDTLVTRSDIMSLFWEYCHVTGLRFDAKKAGITGTKLDAFLIDNFNIDEIEPNHQNCISYCNIQRLIAHHVKTTPLYNTTMIENYGVYMNADGTIEYAVPEMNDLKRTFPFHTGLPGDYPIQKLINAARLFKKEGKGNDSDFDVVEYITKNPVAPGTPDEEDLLKVEADLLERAKEAVEEANKKQKVQIPSRR